MRNNTIAYTLLLTLGFTSLGPAAPQSGLRNAPKRKRPNIIFVLTDDLDTGYPRGAWLDYFPQLKTALTGSGVTFENNFVSVSLCCPSRTTTLRGQYSHNTQIFTNAEPAGGFQKAHDLGLENSTMATWLHGAGYRTVLLGKYLNQYPGRVATYVPPGWDEWYAGEQNGYAQFDYTLNENGKIVFHGSAPEDYLQDVIHAKAVDFLKRTAAHHGVQPFFMWMTPYSPHEPAAFAPRFANRFRNIKAPRPPSFNEADNSHHPDWLQSRSLLSTLEIQQIDTLYGNRLRSMLAVEETVVDLIKTLRETGQLDNTYIFFSSDNGFHLGQHRLNPGKNTEFEEDLRVPLIVRGPGVPAAKRVPQMTVNIDFAPTFADIAGVRPPDFVDGRSLLPLLGSGPAGAWRTAFLLEHGIENGIAADADGRTEPNPSLVSEPPDLFDLKAGVGGQSPPPFKGVRTESHVYIDYPSTAETEIYDLQQDPNEHVSISESENPQLIDNLKELLSALKVCAGSVCRAVENKGVESKTGKLVTPIPSAVSESKQPRNLAEALPSN